MRIAAPLALTGVVVACGGAPAIGEYGAEGVGYGNPNHAAKVREIDEIMMAPVRDGLIAGASVAVTHRGETIYETVSIPLIAK